MSKVYRDSQWDKNGVIGAMLKDITIPRMAKVRQLFDDTKIEDIPAVIREEFDRPEI